MAREASLPTSTHAPERAEVLANVAEMYFLRNLTQAEIAQRVGVTRSMVSRMLSGARAQGIVEFRIHRPVRLDRELSRAIAARFRLRAAKVVDSGGQDDERLLAHLGRAGAKVLATYLKNGTLLGLTWGTAVGATIHALEGVPPLPSLKIVQLLGALGARIEDHDGHALVRALEAKLGGVGYYINAPYLVGSPETAQDLMSNKSIAETLALARKCDVALLGVGSVEPRHSSFYRAGYVTLRELKALQQQGAVGDVCGLHFDAAGRPRGEDSERALRGIPVRIGVAGGAGKVEAVRAALLGGYINVLVTDQTVASALVA
jgi:deoxyribonucleoside regulator